jgi:hypothetical protein
MLQITVNGNELYDFIKVDPGVDDASVATLLLTAKTEAQTFLNTDFSTTAEDGSQTPTEAPGPVKAWVFNRVSQLYETRGPGARPDYGMLRSYRVYPFSGEYAANTIPSVRRC